MVENSVLETVWKNHGVKFKPPGAVHRHDVWGSDIWIMNVGMLGVGLYDLKRIDI